MDKYGLCFKIKGRIALYRIDDNLKLHCSTLHNEYVERDSSNAIIIDILRGKKIIIPTPTEKEQLAIDYAKTCGCKYLTKNRSGKISAFDTKPFKIGSMWVCKGEGYTAGLQIGIPISFINWDDEEPYYIGD